MSVVSSKYNVVCVVCTDGMYWWYLCPQFFNFNFSYEFWCRISKESDFWHIKCQIFDTQTVSISCILHPTLYDTYQLMYIIISMIYVTLLAHVTPLSHYTCCWHVSPGSWHVSPASWHVSPGSWHLNIGRVLGVILSHSVCVFISLFSERCTSVKYWHFVCSSGHALDGVREWG